MTHCTGAGPGCVLASATADVGMLRYCQRHCLVSRLGLRRFSEWLQSPGTFHFIIQFTNTYNCIDKSRYISFYYIVMLCFSCGPCQILCGGPVSPKPRAEYKV